MYLVFVDFSENNLLTSQIGIDSFYELKVLNKYLAEHQLLNFVELPIEKVFMLNSEEREGNFLFEIVYLCENDLFKQLLYLNDEDTVMIIKNNVYFELDFENICKNVNDSEVVKDDDNNPFCIITKVSGIKKILNKNLSLRDIFSEERRFTEIKCKKKAYIKPLQSVRDYKALLNDIIKGETLYKPPFVAEGVFTDSVIPVGDFSIIPPVYIGSGVQIESGSTIGPQTVVYSNTLIAENTSVRNSILFENVYVSSGCFIDGSVCCNNASVKRNTAIFSGSVIGSDALIGEDMTVENNSVINKNVKYDKFNKSPFESKRYFSFDSKFQGLAPDKASLLGSAFATVFRKPKIIVASDGQVNSLSLKLGFISGFMASGGECLDGGVMFKSQILFSSMFGDCEYSVFFSGIGGGTDITIYNSSFQELSRSDCCNLFEFCNSERVSYVSSDECKTIRQIRGLSRVYIREITAFSEEGLPCVDEIVCENKYLVRILECIFNACENNNEYKHKIIVYINDYGTSLNIKQDNVIYSDKQLKKIVFFYLKNSKNTLFESEGYNNLWRYDSVVLLLQVLNIMKKTDKLLSELISELPDCFITGKKVKVSDKNSAIALKISKYYPVYYRNNCFNIPCDKGLVKLKKSDRDKNIRVLCSSDSVDVSKELCDIFCSFLQ